MDVRSIFRFPDPVNETSARLVAAGVMLMGIAFVIVRDGWLLVPLTYGFVARVATGPSLSPLGQLATRVGTPLVESGFGVRSRRVAGPPKRFAQGIGLAFTASASMAWILDLRVVAVVLISMLVAAASLEALFALCLGCVGYSAIWGCTECGDISDRLHEALAQARRESPAEPAMDQPIADQPAVSASGAPAMR